MGGGGMSGRRDDSRGSWQEGSGPTDPVLQLLLPVVAPVLWWHSHGCWPAATRTHCTNGMCRWRRHDNQVNSTNLLQVVVVLRDPVQRVLSAFLLARRLRLHVWKEWVSHQQCRRAV